MKKGIAIAGNMIIDQIKYVQAYPRAHSLTTITDLTRSTGGLVCNCVINLARLDPTLPLQAIGVVGEDEGGDYILSQFSSYPNIDISGIFRKGTTSFTDVMTQPDGGRTFFHYRGSNAVFAPEHIDIDNLQADILHIGYILLLDTMDGSDPNYPTALCRVLDHAKKAGIATSIDVVSEESDRFKKLIPPALAYVDYCIINELEAQNTTGISLRGECDEILYANLQPACEALLEMGVGRWVIIHMPELACGMEKDGSYIQKESWKIPSGFKKSSVGAGDAFASAILYGAYNDWTLEHSIHIAGAVAAYSLSGEGATDAILPLPQLLAEMERLQMKLAL